MFHKTIVPASVVTCSVEARFTSSTAINLILAKSSVLEIYSFSSVNSEAVMRLEMHSSHRLEGNITSIGVVTLGTRDSLLLSFKDAKMSLIEFSSATQQLVTVSIHYYERDEYKNLESNIYTSPSIRVDPASRVAMMQFYTDAIAVLPFNIEHVEQPQSYVLKMSEFNRKNLVDFCFLPGYFEPTVAFLCAASKTWAGRLAVNKDTMSLVVVSMDLLHKTYTTLYTCDNLPYNITRIEPCPSPLGGLILFTPNGLIYIDQINNPGISCPVNSFFSYSNDLSPDNPLNTKKNISDYTALGLDLDGCTSSFLSPDMLLLVLTTGQVFTVELESSDSYSGFNRKKSGVVRFVMTHLGFNLHGCDSAIRIGGGYIQSGMKASRCLGGLGITESSDAALQMGYIFLSSNHAECILLQFYENQRSLGDDADMLDADDDDLYGVAVAEVAQHVVPKPHYQFRICDTIMVAAPLKDICIAKSSNYSTFGFESGAHELDLVACSGDQTQGYLTVLQRNIRPTILMSFDMEGIVDFWTIKFSGSDLHSFVILSTNSTTTILETNEDLEETQTGGFMRNVRTLHSSVFMGVYILQVFTSGAVVLDRNGVLVYAYTCEQGESIRKSSVAGGLCFVEFESGFGRIMAMSTLTNQLEFHPTFKVESVVSACLYEDQSQFFSTNDESVKVRTYLVVYHSDNCIQMYDLCSLEIVYTISNVAELPATITDAAKMSNTVESSPKFVEVCVAGLGSFSQLRTSESDLVIYKCFKLDSVDASMNQRLNVGFAKLFYDISCRDISSTAPSMTLISNIGNYSGVFVPGTHPALLMTTAASHEAYISDDPLAIRLTDLPKHGHSSLHMHAMTLDGPITRLSAFNNQNCTNGFIYLNPKGALRFCTLPLHFEYESEWPVAKIPLSDTLPQKCVYHYTADVVVVSCAKQVEFMLSKAQYASGVAANVIDADDVSSMPQPEHRRTLLLIFNSLLAIGSFYPTVGAYSAVLVSPVTWEIVDKIDMLEYEQILAMQVVLLDSKQTQSGKKLFLAIGTGFLRGEDLSTRGRLLLYDIIDVVPEIDNPQTCHKFKLLNTYDEKGPISAINCCKGNLIVAIGAKIIAYEYDDEKLTGVAFIDTTFYVTEIKVAKNMISLFDIVKSVWFVVFQEEPAKLQLLGKDYYELSIFTGDFIVDDSFMSILAADADGNVHVYQYLPENLESQNGNKLMRKGEFNTNAHLTKMISMRTASSASSYFTLASSNTGSLHAFVPINESKYNRLYALSSKLTNHIQHTCGLNPRDNRQARYTKPPPPGAFTGTYLGMSSARGVIDGDFLATFFGLSVKEREDVCRGIGSDVKVVMRDLEEVERDMAYF